MTEWRSRIEPLTYISIGRKTYEVLLVLGGIVEGVMLRRSEVWSGGGDGGGGLGRKKEGRGWSL